MNHVPLTVYVDGELVARFDGDYRLSDVSDLLRSRIVTSVPIAAVIHGLEGVGKTTLARHLSRHLTKSVIIEHDPMTAGGSIDPYRSGVVFRSMVEYFSKLMVNFIVCYANGTQDMPCGLEGHTVVLLEFDPIRPKESVSRCVHGVSIEDASRNASTWRSMA